MENFILIWWLYFVGLGMAYSLFWQPGQSWHMLVVVWGWPVMVPLLMVLRLTGVLPRSPTVR